MKSIYSCKFKFGSHIWDDLCCMVACLLFGLWCPNVIGTSALNSSHPKPSLYLKFSSSEGDYIYRWSTVTPTWILCVSYIQYFTSGHSLYFSKFFWQISPNLSKYQNQVSERGKPNHIYMDEVVSKTKWQQLNCCFSLVISSLYIFHLSF